MPILIHKTTVSKPSKNGKKKVASTTILIKKQIYNPNQSFISGSQRDPRLLNK